MNNFIQKFKFELKLKDITLWFVFSFVGVTLVDLLVMGRNFDFMLFIEVLGFSLVFVVLMIATKSYGSYIDKYYQSHIDKAQKKGKYRK